MSDYKQYKDYISEALVVLKKSSAPDEEKDYFDSVLTYIDRASGIANSDEKKAHLVDACNRWANQITFRLFRLDELSDELAKTYRTFPNVDETTAEVKKFTDERQTEIDRINAEKAEVDKAMQEIELFRAVIGGMEVEEAKKKQAEYEDNLAKAQAQYAQQAQ